MNIHSYEIKTSVDLLRKLLDEREDFLKQPLSSRVAMNAVITAWHLHEWIYLEYAEHALIKSLGSFEAFRHYLYSRESFENVRDLANGSKHFTLTRKNSSIIGTRLAQPGERLSWKTTLKEPRLIYVTRLGDSRLNGFFDDLLYASTLFWCDFFVKELGEPMIEDLLTGYSDF